MMIDEIPGPRGLVRAHERLRQRGMSDEVLAEHSAEIEVAAGHRALQACQYAHQMGKHAGHNAVSDVLRLPLVEFSPDPYDEILRRADYLTGRRPVSQAAPLPRLTRAT